MTTLLPHDKWKCCLVVASLLVLGMPYSGAFQVTHNAGLYSLTTRRRVSPPWTESAPLLDGRSAPTQLTAAHVPFSENLESNRIGLLRPLRHLLSRSCQRLVHFRSKLAAFAVAMALVFSVSFSALAGPSGYSAGGSFRSRSSSYGRPPIQRYAPSSSTQRRYSTPYPRVTYKPHFHHSRSRHSEMHFGPGSTRTTALAARAISPADYAVLGTTGGLIVYGVAKNQRFRNGQDRNDGDRFGLTASGATAASLTVALNIPDREDPHNILEKLKALMNQADTSSMEGVQFLVAEAALELLRNERSITGCYAESQFYRDPDKAERTFQSTSVNARSQFNYETVRRYGGQEMGQGPENSSKSLDNIMTSKATRGIVTINVAMDGDLPLLVKGRADLIDALRHISADARASHDLFCGEVLLSPGDTEILTEKDLILMQPKLTII